MVRVRDRHEAVRKTHKADRRTRSLKQAPRTAHMGVQMLPGETMFTRTPFLVSSTARALLNEVMAPMELKGGLHSTVSTCYLSFFKRGGGWASQRTLGGAVGGGAQLPLDADQRRHVDDVALDLSERNGW